VLEAGVELAQDSRSNTDERFDAHRTLLRDLLRPAATGWDLRTLQMLWRATERYLRVGFDQLDRTAADAAGFGRAQRELIAGYRSQDPEAARAATLRHVDWNENVADRGLAAAS
jgi:DNA-binding GntR family transcriptional regulator